MKKARLSDLADLLMCDERVVDIRPFGMERWQGCVAGLTYARWVGPLPAPHRNGAALTVQRGAQDVLGLADAEGPATPYRKAMIKMNRERLAELADIAINQRQVGPLTDFDMQGWHRGRCGCLATYAYARWIGELPPVGLEDDEDAARIILHGAQEALGLSYDQARHLFCFPGRRLRAPSAKRAARACRRLCDGWEAKDVYRVLPPMGWWHGRLRHALIPRRRSAVARSPAP